MICRAPYRDSHATHKCAFLAVMNIVKCVCWVDIGGISYWCLAVSIPAKSLSAYTVFIKGCPHSVSPARPTLSTLLLLQNSFAGVLCCPKCPQAYIASSEIRYMQRVHWIMKCLIYHRSTSQEGAPGGNTTPRRNTSALMHRRACGGTDLHYNDLQGTIIWCRHKCSYSWLHMTDNDHIHDCRGGTNVPSLQSWILSGVCVAELILEVFPIDA